MDYDVLILGGGVIGCAVAYELSKYSLNIALIEKDYDIASDVALINSAIIYDGLECSDNLMAKLELMGCMDIYNLAKKFNVPCKKRPSIIVASNKNEEELLHNMFEEAQNRGIKNISLLEGEEIYKMEPNFNIRARKAIYSENTGVICPYDLALAFGEIAFDNGVNFKLQEEVIDIQKLSKGFRVITNKNKFTCNMLLNTTPGQNYSIDALSIEKSIKNRSNLYYFILDKTYRGIFNNNFFTLSVDNNKVYCTQTVQENTIVAIKSDCVLSFNEALKKASSIIGDIEEKSVKNFYHWEYFNDNIIIDDSLIDSGYIKVVGKHYGQVTMTPAIAKIVCETITSNFNCVLKKHFVDKRRDVYRFKNMSNEERQRIIKMDSKYGKVICICEKITEGEIVDSIRRPLGARTIEGVKRRTGASFGSCQGAYCLSKIATILARETNKKLDEIVKDSKNSKLMVGRIKEFNEI